MKTINEAERDMRVQLHPATDAWMRGDRYGTVARVDHQTQRIFVRLDKSQRVRGYDPMYLEPVR